MVKLGLKGLAQFMTATATRQRKVLKDHKHPAPEGYAQAGYYRDARSAIAKYHKNGHAKPWLLHKAVSIDLKATMATGRRKIRLKNNASALRAYAKHFSDRKFTVLSKLKLRLSINGVDIPCDPDLNVKEKGRNRLIRLEFAKPEPDKKIFKIMNQCIHDAAIASGIRIKSSQVECLDIRRGNIHRGARKGSRLANEIVNACKNIAAIWPGI